MRFSKMIVQPQFHRRWRGMWHLESLPGESQKNSESLENPENFLEFQLLGADVTWKNIKKKEFRLNARVGLPEYTHK
jgi:hypothetical protein